MVLYSPKAGAGRRVNLGGGVDCVDRSVGLALFCGRTGRLGRRLER